MKTFSSFAIDTMRNKLTASLVLSIISSCALAQTYPNKAIRLVVPFAPGGSTDIVARIIADPLAKVLGQPVVVDNKAGAGGSLGTAEVAHSQPDGYTVGLATVSTHAVNPAIARKLPYDPERDFQPVTALGTTPNVMVVNHSVPSRSYDDFLRFVKAQDGKVTYASPGVGSLGHMAMELFKVSTHTSMTHVPYRGAGPAKNDIIAGQVQVFFDNLPSSMAYIKSGQVKAVAVAAPARLAALPDVPTFAEIHVPACNDPAWFGLVVPAGTPYAIVSKLQAGVVKVLAEPSVQKQLAVQGIDPVGSTPDQFKKMIAGELAKMRQVARTSKIEVDQ